MGALRDDSPSAETPRAESLAPLSVVVAYADRATHERALRIHDELVEQLAGDCSFEFTWWKFDFLRHADMFEAAVEAAVLADLIIFSVHAAEPLPLKVEEWLRAWCDRREKRRSALIALIGGTTQLAAQALPAHALLQSAAGRARMDFVPHAFPIPPEAPCCLVDALSERAQQLEPLLEELLTRRPVIPYWGINE